MGIHTQISSLFPNTAVYLQLVRFVVVLLGGLLLTRMIVLPVISYFMRRRGSKKETRHSVRNLAEVVGIFVSFTVALQAGNFGSLVTVIGAVAAALTVAIGFGMRDQISNIVAGFFIFLKNPFYVGDYIKTEETEGVIEDISILYTTLEGSSSRSIHVPNSQLTMEEVRNYTHRSATKASISVTLSNKSIQNGMELLQSIAERHEEVLEDPSPEVFYLDEDGEVATELHYWVEDARTSKRIKSEILEAFNEKAVENDLFESASSTEE